MHQETLKGIIDELAALLPGRFLGRVFQLSEFSLALDFGLKGEGYLFVSIEPAAPRLYLIKRTGRELEKTSTHPGQFVQTLRTSLGGGKLLSLSQDAGERVARFHFSVADDFGQTQNLVLVAQLTGRSANLFLLDTANAIIQVWRSPKGTGQQPGDLYAPPATQRPEDSSRKASATSEAPHFTSGTFPTLSAAADDYYRQLAAMQEFDKLAADLRGKLRKEIAKRTKLLANLEQDLFAHGNPETHKRRGDLLLANIATAKRAGNKVSLTDYYAGGTPLVEVELDDDITLPEAAAEAFSRYGKAKRAIDELGTRLLQVKRELTELGQKQAKLEEAIATRELTALAEFAEPKQPQPAPRKKEKASLTLPGMRRYLSSDGYEVLVGRTARDNDQLTFRVARPNDLWLHAGDYPGSHVIVRNSSRDEIPHRTIIEAAQLAAKFSQAGKDSRVAIHYTRRKFLSKPKGAAAGLVRLSNFKTITVAPGEHLERIK
jgi:predicted ribosome quality control (RQC) complex YloA/Tae2 family protein